jgi:long-subunit fatty acid transport protein
MKHRVFACLVAGAASVCAPAMAEESASPWQLVGSVGVGFGGDSLAKGEYSSGTDFSIRAGSGLTLAVGAAYQVTPKWAVQSTVGYQFDTTNASDGEIDFTRYPVELLGFYTLNDRWRLGAGLRSATSATLGVSGAGYRFSSGEKFKSGLGQILEVQYFMGESKRFALSGRYVLEEFESKQNGRTVSGNHIGLMGTFYY